MESEAPYICYIRYRTADNSSDVDRIPINQDMAEALIDDLTNDMPGEFITITSRDNRIGFYPTATIVNILLVDADEVVAPNPNPDAPAVG